MSTNNKLLNPLVRDGTSQAQRLVRALQPSTAKIDDRNIAALLRYAHDYAGLLRFYTPDDKEAGDWVPFLENDPSVQAALHESSEGLSGLLKNITSDPSHEPQMALLLAFLRLFRYQQKQLNTLTRSHLDFYYRDVLQLSMQGGHPDSVHVIFELAKKVEGGKCLIPKDTVLLAGKDAQQVDLLYATDRECVINTAEIDAIQGLKSIFVETTPVGGRRLVANIYAADKANSLDGKGAALTDDDHKWLTFGAATMPYARTGFAIASSMFLLAEGTRTITIDLRSSPTTDFLAGETVGNVQTELRENITVQASGAKQWIDLTTESVSIDSTAGVLSFTLSLDASAPAIVSYNPKILSENFVTHFPVLRFVFNNEALSAAAIAAVAGREILDYSDQEAYGYQAVVRYERKLYQAKVGITKSGICPPEHEEVWEPLPVSYPYKHFEKLEVRGVDIAVEVSGIRSLIVENDFGLVNPAKPFQPFGPMPRKGSQLLIGSREVFQKRLTGVALRVEWAGLPKENFSAYYEEYKDKQSVPNNEHFTASVDLLADGNWLPGKIDSLSTALVQLQVAKDVPLDSVVFSPDGKHIGAVSQAVGEGRRLFNVINGTKAETHSSPLSTGSGKVLLLTYDSKSTTLIAVLESGIYLWNLGDNKPPQQIPNLPTDIQAIVLNDDKNTVVLSSAKSGLSVQHLSGNVQQAYRSKAKPKLGMTDTQAPPLAMTPDGKYLLSASGKTVQLWMIPKTGPKPVARDSLELQETVKKIRFLRSGISREDRGSPPLVFAVIGATLSFWSYDIVSRKFKALQFKQKAPRKVSRGLGAILDFYISPDGSRAVMTSDGGAASLWAIEERHIERIRTLSLPSDAGNVTALTFDRLGSGILMGTESGLISQWNAKSGVRISPLEAHTSPIRTLAFEPFGTKILSLDGAGVALLWGDGVTAVTPLFTPPGTKLAPKASREIVPEFDWDTLDAARDPQDFTAFDNTLPQGFLRLVLNESFLHEFYPPLLAAAAQPGGTVPNPPYTPAIASISVDYSAVERVDYSGLRKKDFDSRVQQLFQLGPFGQREIFPIADDSAAGDIPIGRTLVPDFRVEGTHATEPAEGALLIGLTDLSPPQNLSILFQVAEGSEDGSMSPPKVVWSHLDRDRWVDFATTEIVFDSTNGLLGSGIIQFSMPVSMSNTNTSMPSGLRWIKASAQERSTALPKMIAVRTQAVVASFRDQGNDPARLAVPLPANTISKLQNRRAEIKSVSQPYASFSGKAPESMMPFYVRTSEQLRHKHRAVTIFDFERLVLREFPEVYKVKCINHTSTASEHAPACVRVVVMANLRNRNAVDQFQPRLSSNRRENIRAFLAELASDFVSIEVTDPDYEQIRVRFRVRFQAGCDKGYYTTQLNKDIIRFLSPWLYDDSVDLNFGGSIHRSTILNWIEEREYVDFVVDFEMDHIIGKQVLTNVEEAVATRSSSVIVSAPNHEIGNEIASCGDQPVVVPAPPVPVPEPPPVPPGLERYLGNMRTLEVHDLLHRNPNCQIDEIQNRLFTQLETALRLGYDYCAFCFSRHLSQR